MNLPRTALFLLAITLASGCASVAVTGDAIEQKTAFALGIERGSFTISNRADDGLSSTYQVTTQSGKKYSCYVEGTVALYGRVVSDAVCKPAGKAASRSGNPETSSCNALLKAAGKC